MLLWMFIVWVQAVVFEQVATSLQQKLTVNGYGQTTDSDPRLGMDCLKMIHEQNGSIGVFHHTNSTSTYSNLFCAESPGLSPWSNVHQLSVSGSQPTLVKIPSTSFYFLAFEHEDHQHGNTIAVRFYQNYSQLQNNHYLYQYQLAQIIDGKKVRNVGTPSFDRITTLKVEKQTQFNSYYLQLKFHYSPDGTHDYPGLGFLQISPLHDFVDEKGRWIGGTLYNSPWNGETDRTVFQIMRQKGCEGKIGQRDSFQISGVRFYLYQCNILSQFSWENWRIFLFSPTLQEGRILGLSLDGDIDLANPHITLVQENEKYYHFSLTFFLPSEGVPSSSSVKPGQAICQWIFPVN